MPAEARSAERVLPPLTPQLEAGHQAQGLEGELRRQPQVDEQVVPAVVSPLAQCQSPASGTASGRGASRNRRLTMSLTGGLVGEHPQVLEGLQDP